MSIILNSKDRESGTPNEFVLKLRDPIQGRWSLQKVTMANVIPNINANAHRFRFVWGTTTHTVSLMYGMWTIEGICESLRAAMAIAVGHDEFRVAFVPQTGRIVVTPQTSGTFFEARMDDLAQSCGEVLGFTENVGLVGGACTGDKPVNLARGSVALYVRLNNIAMITNGAGESAHYASFVVWNVDTNSFGLFTQDAAHTMSQIIDVKERTRLIRVSLHDSEGQLVPLEADWTFVLRKCRC